MTETRNTIYGAARKAAVTRIKKEAVEVARYMLSDCNVHEDGEAKSEETKKWDALHVLMCADRKVAAFDF